MEADKKSQVMSKIEKKNQMVDMVQRQKQEENERRKREESEKRAQIEQEMMRQMMDKEREKEMRLKKIQEQDEMFNERKMNERVAREKVQLIKDTLQLRKKEIVTEIKALRDNFKVKGIATSATKINQFETNQSSTS